MAKDLYHEPRAGLGGTARLVGESVQVFVVAGYYPPALGLPVVVVYQNLQLVANPLVGRDIAPLTSHRHRLQARKIVFVHPLSIVVLLADGPQACRTRIETIHLVLLNYCPKGARIGDGRLTFVDDGGSSSEQGAVDGKAVANDPSDITCCEVGISEVDVHDVIHRPVEGHCGSSVISDDALRSSSGSGGVEDI